MKTEQLGKVAVPVSVELGRTMQSLEDLTGWREGSIIELDKLAGEPVDILAAGEVIAKGEVVIIDENFGVRITDLTQDAKVLQE